MAWVLSDSFRLISRLTPTITGAASSGKAGDRHHILRNSPRRIAEVSEHWVWKVRDLRCVGGHRRVVSISKAFAETPLPPLTFFRRATDDRTSKIKGDRGIYVPVEEEMRRRHLMR